MGSIVDHIRENVLPASNLALNDRLIAYFSTHFIGNGSPEGVVTAVVGSTYLRRDGGTGTTLYIKESGAGNTGWTAISQAAAGTGFSGQVTKSQRVTTGSILAAASADVTITWTTAFADANYTVNVSVEDASALVDNGLRVRRIRVKSATQIVVVVENANTVTAVTGTLHAVAVHD